MSIFGAEKITLEFKDCLGPKISGKKSMKLAGMGKSTHLGDVRTVLLVIECTCILALGRFTIKYRKT